MTRLRIAVATSVGRKVGGTEHYLDAVIADLAIDHDIALWCDAEGPLDRDEIATGLDITRWIASDIGLDEALAELVAWRPDVVYVHALYSPDVERQLLAIGPNILFPHNYLGTCISGQKMWATPRPLPCSRRLGAGCLAHFYPHRCGGLNPVRMLYDFQRASRRAALLPRYHAVLTTSAHMREEMIRNGASADRTFTPPYVALDPRDQLRPDVAQNAVGNPVAALRAGSGDRDRLLFVGRMHFLKGGSVLLAALVEAARLLDRPLHLTMAGDGPDRADWERQAAALRGPSNRVTVDFKGWLRSAELLRCFSSADLLVVPSVWPEPFGIVGPQAGSAGLPAAAFDAGGISEWLTDGVNGHLARADPPSADGLAKAIALCLADPVHYARLSAAAIDLSQRFNLRRHTVALREIFKAMAGSIATVV